MSQLLIVGQAPSRTSEAPLEGKCGRRIAELLMTTWASYLRLTERVNLLEEYPGRKKGKGDRFDSRKAGRRARKIEVKGRVVVLLGREVMKAFGLGRLEFFEFETHRGGRFVGIPHPSGVNRLYNDLIIKTVSSSTVRAAMALALSEK